MPEKLYHDTKVESWALWFCLPPLPPMRGGLTKTNGLSMINDRKMKNGKWFSLMILKNSFMRIKLYFAIMIAVFISSNVYSQTDTNVIYTDLNPDVYIWHTNYLQSHTDSFKIDINEDDTMDLKFYFVVQSITSWFYIAPLNSKCKYGFFHTSDSDSLSSSNVSWRNIPYEWRLDLYDSIRIAVKIIDGSDTYYGWIKVLAQYEGQHIYSYTFYKYAFCKIPNYPFLWGQTDILTQIPETKNDNHETVTVCQNDNTLFVKSNEYIKTITILNTAGIKIFSKSDFNENAVEIKTDNIAHGAYILKIVHNDGRVTNKKIVL